jgi:ketosteroid isomerase-like protein
MTADATPEAPDVQAAITAVLAMVESGFSDQGQADVQALLAEGFVEHVPFMEGDPWGRIQYLKTAFPDVRMTVRDLIVDGNRAVWRWTFTGTHHGEFNGIAPTGKQVEYDGVSIEQVHEGKIIERWDFPDLLTALRQLGALP